jgi:hypothetical protein
MNLNESVNESINQQGSIIFFELYIFDVVDAVDVVDVVDAVDVVDDFVQIYRLFFFF